MSHINPSDYDKYYYISMSTNPRSGFFDNKYCSYYLSKRIDDFNNPVELTVFWKNPTTFAQLDALGETLPDKVTFLRKKYKSKLLSLMDGE